MLMGIRRTETKQKITIFTRKWEELPGHTSKPPPSCSHPESPFGEVTIKYVCTLRYKTWSKIFVIMENITQKFPQTTNNEATKLIHLVLFSVSVLLYSSP